LLHQWLDIIWKTNQEEVSFALDIQKKFSDLFIQGANTSTIIDEFSRIIETPIILLNPFKEMKATSKFFRNSNTNTNQYISQIVDNISNSNNKEEMFIITDPSGDQINILVKKIFVYNYYPHYLVVFNYEQTPFPTSTFAVEQAGLILSFILFKNQKVLESRLTFEADFFNEVLDAKGTSQITFQNNVELTKNLGYIQSNFYQVISVIEKTALTTKTPSKKQKEKINLINLWLRKHIDKYFEDAVVIYIQSSNKSFFILQSNPDHLEKSLTQLQSDFKQSLPFDLIFSIGNAYMDIENINQSYTQAQLTLEDLTMHNYQMVNYYHNNSLHHLFKELDSEQSHYFCLHVLKDLAFPTSSNLIDLRKTLKIYLDSQCEITKTADALFVHRNTVTYRIKRCEELLDTKIDSPENSLNIRLALSLSES